MLVLSRQKNQRINFPGLGVSVEILDVKGSKVRVGIDAPLEVRIVRDEIEDFGKAPQRAGSHSVRLPGSRRHDLRNALHELSLMLHVYRKKSELAGDDPAIDATQMFEAIIQRIEVLSTDGAISPFAPTHETDAPGRAGDALVVDDDANERELLAGFLRMCDYRVRTASDGFEALAVLEGSDPPGVVLLDMTMPRRDGKGFLRDIRSRECWNPVHVFVVSGRSPAELGISPSDGYTRWFQKPLDPRRIVGELARIERSTHAVA